MSEVRRVASIDPPGSDDAHRRLVRFHVSDLHARGVGAQQRGRALARPRLQGAVEVERVLHVPRGMLGWHVERFEVVVVVLRLGSLQNLEPETSEDLFDLFPKDRERMAMAHGGRTARQRDIDRAGRRARGGKLRATRRDRPGDLVLEGVGITAEGRPLVSGRRSDGLEQRGDRTALAAEVAVPEGLEVVLAGDLLELRKKGCPESVYIGGGGHMD